MRLSPISLQALSCPRIVNGTLIEVSEEEEVEEEEEKEEIEDIPRQVNRYGNDQMNRFGNQANRYNEPMNRYNPNDRYNQRFNDNMNRDVERLRNGQQPDVRRQPFGKAEEKEEAEEEEVREVVHHPLGEELEELGGLLTGLELGLEMGLGQALEQEIFNFHSIFAERLSEIFRTSDLTILDYHQFVPLY